MITAERKKKKRENIVFRFNFVFFFRLWSLCSLFTMRNIFFFFFFISQCEWALVYARVVCMCVRQLQLRVILGFAIQHGIREQIHIYYSKCFLFFLYLSIHPFHFNVSIRISIYLAWMPFIPMLPVIFITIYLWFKRFFFHLVLNSVFLNVCTLCVFFFFFFLTYYLFIFFLIISLVLQFFLWACFRFVLFFVQRTFPVKRIKINK